MLDAIETDFTFSYLELSSHGHVIKQDIGDKNVCTSSMDTNYLMAMLKIHQFIFHCSLNLYTMLLSRVAMLFSRLVYSRARAKWIKNDFFNTVMIHHK